MVLPTKKSDEKFSVRSQSISGNRLADKQVYNDFGYTGGNESPELKWCGAPEGTRSFAVTVYDQDAPTGSGWWHWVVYNIPAYVTSLPEGAGLASGKALPEGAKMGRNDFGTKSYGGACPPPGREHRYIFAVHALSTDEIEVPEDASPAMIGFNLGNNCIDKAILEATFGN